MSWPAALLTKRRRMLALFAVAELSLAMAVPFLAIAGYHALLDSRAGRFVEEPSEGDPGWRALVDPSPLVAVVEVDADRLTGIALLAASTAEEGGTAILVPGTLQVEGRALAAREPADAVAALSGVLRLRVTSIEVMTAERWAAVLDDATYELPNPDPVTDAEGRQLLTVGSIAVGAADVPVFLGRPAPGTDPITLGFRRNLLWSALVADPPPMPSPDSADPMLVALHEVAGPSARVVDLPLVRVAPDPSPDLDRAEILIRDAVPVPAGAKPGDRLQVRVIDRTGIADLAAIAAEVASTGSEVVEIGNAREFDGGLTHLVVPPGVDDPSINELALLTGATTVLDDEVDADSVVTLLIGSDFLASR